MSRSIPSLLLHVYPTFAVGGAQVRFARLANRFGPRWRHAIVAMNGDVSCRERLDPAVDVTFPQIALPKGETLGNIRRCRAMLRALGPNMLVTTNWGTIEWAMANQPALVNHVHVEEGLGPDEVNGQFHRRIWTRQIVLRRSTVVVPSRDLHRIAAEIWHLPPRRLRYIPNGVDLTRFDRPFNRPNAPPVIGSVAVLRPEKNFRRMLQAFRLVRDSVPARLVIVGDGPERPALEALAATLGLARDVSFAGHMTDAEQAYAGFDIFALSSDTEQMPLSILEAMAAGLPVVATDVGDVRTMVASQNRPFIVARDHEAMARALLQLLSAPVEQQDIGAANRAEAVRRFDQEAMFAAWAEVFDGGPSWAGTHAT